MKYFLVSTDLLTQIVSPESSGGNTHLCIIYICIWVPNSVKRYPTALTHAAQTFKQTKNIIGDHRENFTKLHSGLTIWASEPVSCIQRFSHSLNSCSTNIWTYKKTGKKIIGDHRNEGSWTNKSNRVRTTYCDLFAKWVAT